MINTIVSGAMEFLKYLGKKREKDDKAQEINRLIRERNKLKKENENKDMLIQKQLIENAKLKEKLKQIQKEPKKIEKSKGKDSTTTKKASYGKKTITTKGFELDDYENDNLDCPDATAPNPKYRKLIKKKGRMKKSSLK